MNNQSISHERLKRATIVLVGILLIFAILLGRIFWIQTVDFDKYLSNVMDQITTQTSVAAERGTIYDKNGNILATNITTYRIFISPSSIRNKQVEAERDGKSVNYAEDISRGLARILGLDYDTVYKQTSYTQYHDRTIAKHVRDDKTDEVRKFIEDKGYGGMIHIQAMSTRYYPNSELASSVIGFTNSDGDGLYGLEAQYDKILAGTDGYYVSAQDSYGNEMPYEYESYIPAKNGGNLTTTIDAYIQQCLEEQLIATVNECGAQNRACGIVVNVKTGAILGMATVPGFDLNDPWTLNEYYSNFLLEDGLTEGTEEYEKTKQKYLMDMWRNKAVSDSYIPGSTFKVISSSMALTENKVQLDDCVFCGGYRTLSGHRIHCHVTDGHGDLTFPQGLVQSCNVWFMEIGERLGKTAFYDYFRSFGYLEKTGIDLPGEGNSVIKTQNDMKDLDLCIYAFGQNFNITPIQHVMAIAAVANGGYLIEPYLVEQITDNQGNVTYQHETEIKRQVVSKEVCDKLGIILEEGVSGNGGAKNVYVAGYKIAAKTGTSEKKGTEIRVDNVKPYICSCVAFAPADDPEIAILIMVDEPSQGVLYGSVIAAPYMGALMEDILPYLGYEKDVSVDNSVKVPYLMGMPLEEAILQAEDYEYEIIIKGDGKYVTNQVPKGSTVIDRTNKVITLYTGDAPEEKTVTVPDLVGMKTVAANSTLVNAKLNICIDGTDNYTGGGAMVVKQSIPAGTKVSPGTVVTITVRYLDPDESKDYFDPDE